MGRPFCAAQGYALITAMIIMTVTAGLVMGFIAQVNIQQKISLNDGDYATAFYAAEAGLEKLNSDLSKQFYMSVYPTATQLSSIQGSSYQPQLSGVTYTTYSIIGGQQARLAAALNNSATTATVDSTSSWDSSGYFMIDAEYITYTGKTSTTFTGLTRGTNGTTAAAHLNNARVSRSNVITLSQGPNAGLNAQIIPFTLQVVARATSGTEAKLNRDIQVALVPVFQFGMFSESDLSFFALPNFTFNGRVHTNANLFLAQWSPNTLTLQKKVTAVSNVIRAQLSNGVATTGLLNGTVNMMVTPGTNRALARTEGSVVGGPGSAVNNGPPSWQTLSLTTYNGNILSGATGARPLTLPFTGPGVTPIEIIRRAPSGEDPLSIISESRLYNQASLRVLLSDSQSNLPGGSGYALNTSLYTTNGGPYTVDTSHSPFAAADSGDADYRYADNTAETTNRPLLDGYIKIEMQTNNNTWQDVTMEILNLGISGGAVLRFQKLKPAKASGSTTETDYMPLNIFDPREGAFRETGTQTGMRKIGIMGFVELDVNNLKRWFAGTIGTNGNQANNTNNGYIFYFSDRRGNRDGSGNETGEFGFEDVANPADGTNGLPNNSPESGEDFNGNTTFETYGGNLPISPYTAYPTNKDLYNFPVNQSTALTSGISSATNPANGGTVSVSSTSGWLAPGSFVVDNEVISFAGLTATSFTNITRGASGTTAAAHSNGTAVYDLGEATTLSVNGSTTLSVALTAGGASTVTVASTAIFPPAPATIRIGSENITYSAKTATTFTVVSRGAYGSSAASHAINSAVTEPAIASTHPASGEWMGVAQTVGWGTSGYLLTGGEYITYSSKIANAVQVQTRGAFGSTAASHTTGDAATNTARAQKNRVWYFRRALKLVNDGAPNLPTPGFTVAAENPVYVQGDYNAAGSFTGAHSYAAVIADTVTMLSNNWRDINGFDNPYAAASRPGTTTWYRMAIAAGKVIGFPQPTGAAWDVGLDAGVINFLRYVEDWTGATLNYMGSLVSMYYSRQATGNYKCCGVVYQPPTRAYSFDTEFLVPSQLPPGTPRFRDINNLSFRQNILANQ